MSMKIEGETKRVLHHPRPSFSISSANALDDRLIPQTSDGIKLSSSMQDTHKFYRISNIASNPNNQYIRYRI